MSGASSLSLRLLFGVEALVWAGLLIGLLFQLAAPGDHPDGFRGLISAMVVITLAMLFCSGLGARRGEGVVSGRLESGLDGYVLLAGWCWRPLLAMLVLWLTLGSPTA